MYRKAVKKMAREREALKTTTREEQERASKAMYGWWLSFLRGVGLP